MEKIHARFNIIFSAGMTLAFAYGIYESLSYAYLAKVFPLSISLVLFVVSLVNLAREIRELRTVPGMRASGGISADLESDWDIPMKAVWSKLLVYAAGMLILYFFIWIIGYPLSITLFIVFFYRYVTETGWPAALIAGAAGMGFLALVSKLLTMDWPQGLIHLPWPLG